MRQVDYWSRLFYNGVVIGVWPSAALAYLLTNDQRTLHSFITIFLPAMTILVPLIMWLYHVVIWRRRKR